MSCALAESGAASGRVRSDDSSAPISTAASRSAPPPRLRWIAVQLSAAAIGTASATAVPGEMARVDDRELVRVHPADADAGDDDRRPRCAAAGAGRAQPGRRAR
jgi:hypothetical protein